MGTVCRPRVRRVMGVDACRKGWVGVTGDRRGYFGTTIDRLVAGAELDGVLDVVAVDIPIGLPVDGVRRADVLARGLVGKRRSSVFATPTRAALLAGSHAEGSATNLRATGKGMSRQAYGLARKILEVDAWIRDQGRAVIEVHPELSFATMAGRPLDHPKWSWAGSEERRALLARCGVEVPGDLGVAGERAGVDDVLDAAAACWTARRYAAGRAVSHPDPPERFGDGAVAAIWC